MEPKRDPLASSSASTNLPDLPADIITMIIRFMPLDALALTRLARVCKRLKTITKNERLWKEVVLARWSCPDLLCADCRGVRATDTSTRWRARVSR